MTGRPSLRINRTIRRRAKIDERAKKRRRYSMGLSFKKGVFHEKLVSLPTSGQ
jgi:hypothetical protein